PPPAPLSVHVRVVWRFSRINGFRSMSLLLAVKFNIGKYMQALTASNSDMDLNPLIRLNLQTTRTWTDNGAGGGIANDFAPQCNLLNPAANGECGPMDNQNF